MLAHNRKNAKTYLSTECVRTYSRSLVETQFEGEMHESGLSSDLRLNLSTVYLRINPKLVRPSVINTAR